MTIVSALETRYAGYIFRSRLEARWAVFFQTLSKLTRNHNQGPLRWEYEPEGFALSNGDWYLPDFRVYYPGQEPSEAEYVWFEVKPSIESISEEDWKKLLCFGESQKLILLDGIPTTQVYLTVQEAWAHDPMGPPIDHGWFLWNITRRLWADDWGNGDGLAEEQWLAINAARAARF